MKKIIFTAISAISALTCIFAACANNAPDTADLDFDVPKTEEQWIKAWNYADSVKKIALHSEEQYGYLYLDEDDYKSGNYTKPEYTNTTTQDYKADLFIGQGRIDINDSGSLGNSNLRYVKDGNKLKSGYKSKDNDWKFDIEEYESEADIDKLLYHNYGILASLNDAIAMYGGTDVNLKNAFGDFTYNAETNEFSARYSGEYRPPYTDFTYDYSLAEISISLQFKNGKLIKVSTYTYSVTTSYKNTNINIGTTTTTFPDYGEDEVIPPELLEELLALT